MEKGQTSLYMCVHVCVHVPVSVCMCVCVHSEGGLRLPEPHSSPSEQQDGHGGGDGAVGGHT